MAVTFYTGSGSPFGWRVWLSLDHKLIPYTLEMLSFSKGDLGSPAYRAINPRAQVPSLLHDGFVLWESAAIVEYIDAVWPTPERPLFPADPRGAAIVRRMVREADEYFAIRMEALVSLVLRTPEPERDALAIARARTGLVAELATWERVLADVPFLAGDLSAADYTLYPLLALVTRMEKREPRIDVASAIGPGVRAWQSRVETLPHFEGTYPSHWR